MSFAVITGGTPYFGAVSKDFAYSGGAGTECEIHKRFQLEFEITWRYFRTQDDKVWPDVDHNGSNTHAMAISLGATYGLF